jgi:hypothetical protein
MRAEERAKRLLDEWGWFSECGCPDGDDDCPLHELTKVIRAAEAAAFERVLAMFDTIFVGTDLVWYPGQREIVEAAIREARDA